MLSLIAFPILYLLIFYHFHFYVLILGNIPREYVTLKISPRGELISISDQGSPGGYSRQTK